MTKPLQPRHNHVRDAGFESVNAIVVKAAWQIERPLDIHVVVHYVCQQVGLASRLELTAHDAERHHGAASTRC
jgi:hypothetical protein